MAFDLIPAKTASKIIDNSVQLFDPDPDGDEIQGIGYSVQVRYSDGSLEVEKGDLVPHLTGAQISALQDFMASLRVQANSEFLGV